MAEFRQQIERLFSVAPWAMLVVDEDGRIATANALAEKLFQYSVEELVGQPLGVFIPAGVHDAHVRDGSSDVRSSPTALMQGLREHRAVRKNGGEFPIEMGISTLHAETKTFTVASIVDVTERKHAEHLFHQLFQSAPDGTVVVDRSGRIKLVNTRAEEMFGYTSEELIDQPIEVLVPEQFRCPHTAHVARYRDHPSVRPMGANRRFSARRKDGSEFPVEISLAPVETLRGLMVFSSIRDVTEHRQLMRQLAGNLEIQHATADILRLSMAALPLTTLLDESLKLLRAVPWLGPEAASAVFLVDDEDPETLVLSNHQGLPDELALRYRRVAVRHWLHGTEPCEPEVIFAANIDDPRVLTESNMSARGHYLVPMLTDGQLLGVLHVCPPANHQRGSEQTDFLSAMADLLAGLVKRKRAELAQRKGEERFELAVRGTDAGIWDWDLRSNQVYFSPQWKGMLGYRSDEISDDFTEWETRLHPDDRQRAFETIRDYLQGRSDSYELEHRLRHKDGSYLRILARGVAVFDDRGHAYRMVGSHLDVTRLRDAEQQVQENQVQLLAAHRIQQRLLPQSAPRVPGWDIAGVCFAAEYAAGDYFDFLTFPDGTLGLVIADVRGHGVGPALLMATASAYIRSFAGLELPLTQMLNQTNKMLCQQMEEDQFITLLVCRLDPATRTLTYVNAGHPEGYIIGVSGAVTATLGNGGLPLGIVPDTLYPESRTIKLAPGDTVLLLTDGLLETRAPAGELLGTPRVIDLVRAHHDRSTGGLIQLLRDEVDQFSGCEALKDDVTIVVAKMQATL